MRALESAPGIWGGQCPEFERKGAAAICHLPGVFNVFDREMDAVPLDSIANISPYAGLEELLPAWIRHNIMDLIELARDAGGQNQDHEMSCASGRRTGECADVHVFDFIGNFAHRRQGNFSYNPAREITGRGRNSGAGPKLERPRALIGG